MATQGQGRKQRRSLFIRNIGDIETAISLDHVITYFVSRSDHVTEHKRPVSSESQGTLQSSTIKTGKITIQQLRPISQRRCENRQKRASPPPPQEKQAEHHRGDSRCHTSGPHPHRCSPWHDFSGSCCCPAPPRVTALHPQQPELQSGHGHSYEMPQM